MAQQETVLRSTPLEVTADGMRGLFVGSIDNRAGVYAYDLSSPTLDLTYLAPTLFGLAEQSLRRTPNPRFVSLARGSDLGVVDLVDGTRSQILPAGATRLELDPLGRYLSYAIRTSSGIELHIEALDGSSPNRVIELRDLPWQTLWVK